MAEEKGSERRKVSFYKKDTIECPVCLAKFHHEEPLIGGGRINAGDVTDEFHRTYIPSKRYGSVYPLIYSLFACPNCYYTVFGEDFTLLKTNELNNLKGSTKERQQQVRTLFPECDFNTERDVISGIGTYILGLFCYEGLHSELTPTFKQALCAIRAAWLCGYAHNDHPDENYDYLQKIFYRKAAFLYRKVYELEGSSSSESVTAYVQYYGPDTDNNYGYDSVIYLAGFLEFKYGSKENAEIRLQKLDATKTALARLVGMGKSSKSKSSKMIDMAKELYENIKTELSVLENGGE